MRDLPATFVTQTWSFANAYPTRSLSSDEEVAMDLINSSLCTKQLTEANCSTLGTSHVNLRHSEIRRLRSSRNSPNRALNLEGSIRWWCGFCLGGGNAAFPGERFPVTNQNTGVGLPHPPDSNDEHGKGQSQRYIQPPPLLFHDRHAEDRGQERAW